MSSSSGSVAFDRAADFYDRTRALPPEVFESVLRLLRQELNGRGRCLEIGVGTGRIALPLAEAGVEMAGVDISSPMLAKLVEKAGGRSPFPVAAADATRLPFPEDVFGAAVACHVLHLIPEWRRALAELVRVVSRGGVVLIDPGSFGEEGLRTEIRRRLMQEAGRRTLHAGLNDLPSLDEAMGRAGAVFRELPPITYRNTRPLEEVVSAFEDNIYAFTWSLDDVTRRRAAARVRTWAAKRFGPLDEPFVMESKITWRAYDLPDWSL